jgi:muramoyltetrapeptide carboxypeptidase LdcA involved in peptidoglycan recycling
MPIHRLTPGSSRLLPAGMAITGVALLAAAFVPEAAGAHTTALQAGTTTCGGSQTVAYSPGLTLKTRQVTLHGTSTLSRCASTSDPTITAARSTFKATGKLSCTSGTYSGTRKITWNNGRTSTLSFNSVVSVNVGQSVVAIKGAVTDGEFSGQKWSAAFTMFTTKPGSCMATEGLPTASGKLLLNVGSLVPGMPVPEKHRVTLR